MNFKERRDQWENDADNHRLEIAIQGTIDFLEKMSTPNPKLRPFLTEFRGLKAEFKQNEHYYQKYMTKYINALDHLEVFMEKQGLGTVKSKPLNHAILVLSAPKERYSTITSEETRAVENCFQMMESKNVVQIRKIISGDLKIFLSLDKYPPSFIHFIGHGNSQGNKLLLQNSEGSEEELAIESIAEFLDQSNSQIKINLAFFNSCNSARLAEMVSKFADYAIGWNNEVVDSVARAFAENFYLLLEEKLRLGDVNSIGSAIETAFTVSKLSIFGFDKYSKEAEILLFKN